MSLEPVGAAPKLGAETWREALWNPSLLAGTAIALLVAGMALLSYAWTPFDPTQMVIAERLRSPSTAHWFGTDHFGRTCSQ